MDNNLLNKSTIGYCLSFAITTIFSGLLVIIKESFEPLKQWMTVLTGHHWVTHGVLTLILFFVAGYIISKMELQSNFSAIKLYQIVIWSTIIGSLLVGVFFLIHIL